MPTKIKWTKIPKYEGYFVSRCGKIKGPSGKVLKAMSTPTGHLYILTRRPGVSRKLFVHRAVLYAYVGLPQREEETRHINGNPKDNRIENLHWGSKIENQRDRKQHGTDNKPHLSPHTKLTPRDIPKIWALTKLGKSSRKIANAFNTSHTTIQKILKGQRWVGYGN